MVVSIVENDSRYVYLTSKDKRFEEAWGQVFRSSKTVLFNDMSSVATWCNNELKEECLFEVV